MDHQVIGITEACKLYAAEAWTKEELIDFLVAFDFPPVGKPNEFGEYSDGFVGTWWELYAAEAAGLISSELLDEVDERRCAREQSKEL